jgi:endo-1,4-beta-xylanase
MKGTLTLFVVLCITLSSAIPILRDLAQKHGIYMGSCSNHGYLGSDANYTSILGQQYSIVTPENEMKWQATEPSQNSFTYSQGDAIVAYAKKANQHVRGHNLCWGESNPTWLTNGGFSGQQLQSILQNHINNVMNHYKGQLYSWDVVNEAVSDSNPSFPSNYLKTNVWYPSVPNYVDLAFQWARAADPHVKLFYNDYGAEGSGAKSDAVYNMLASMKQRGIPVDGVGLQYHVSLGYTPNINDVVNNIKRLNALGLEVQITELDVSFSGGNGNEASELQSQASIYGAVLNACLTAHNCSAFVSWGFTDKYTWLGSNEQPLPFNANYQPKPAFNTLASTLS